MDGTLGGWREPAGGGESVCVRTVEGLFSREAQLGARLRCVYVCVVARPVLVSPQQWQSSTTASETLTRPCTFLHQREGREDTLSCVLWHCVIRIHWGVAMTQSPCVSHQSSRINVQVPMQSSSYNAARIIYLVLACWRYGLKLSP